jgi:hypothetical protein
MVERYDNTADVTNWQPVFSKKLSYFNTQQTILPHSCVIQQQCANTLILFHDSGKKWIEAWQPELAYREYMQAEV